MFVSSQVRVGHLYNIVGVFLSLQIFKQRQFAFVKMIKIEHLNSHGPRHGRKIIKIRTKKGWKNKTTWKRRTASFPHRSNLRKNMPLKWMKLYLFVASKTHNPQNGQPDPLTKIYWTCKMTFLSTYGEIFYVPVFAGSTYSRAHRFSGNIWLQHMSVSCWYQWCFCDIVT